MSLKGLRSFIEFNATDFLKDKELLWMNHSDWVDYDSEKVVGTKLMVIIWSDNTIYKKDCTTNEGSTIDIRILGLKSEKVN